MTDDPHSILVPATNHRMSTDMPTNARRDIRHPAIQQLRSRAIGLCMRVRQWHEPEHLTVQSDAAVLCLH